MSRMAAFFRGLNLGNRRLTNDELCAAVEGAGFDGVEAYLASGNVVFDGAEDGGAAEEDAGERDAALEARLEAHLRTALGYEVDTFVRPLARVAAVARADPFAGEAGGKVHVMFFKETLPPAEARALEALGNDDDRFAVEGREAYWFRRGGLMDATVETRAIDDATGGRTRTMRTLNTLARMARKFGALALALALGVGLSACAGADDEAPVPPDATPAAGPRTPEAISLFGDSLYAMEDTTGAIAEADARLARAPDDVEALIEAGRVRRNFWQYRDAMVLYSRAIQLAPDDWRPWRFRGHRHVSLRQFEPAIADLERARELAPMNWDVAYHLGLAYYLDGRFGAAADEYLRCLALADDPEAAAAQADDFRSCSQNADDPESRVAMTEWAVRAAQRAGRDDVADSLLAAVPTDLDVSENVAYYHDLLLYKGEMTAEELLNPGPDAPYRRETVGYGVANWWLLQGDTAAAVELLEELVQDPWWPGFGRIAAEVELYRLRPR